MKTLFVLATMIAVIFLAAPSKIEAQKRSGAATPSAETVANFYFRYRVTSQSGGALSPTGFRKTNGYESSFGLYVMEWQGEVLFQQDGYKAGDMFVGYWQNFSVLNQKPGTLDSLIVGNTIFFNKGTTVRLTGTATFRKTEKGPRLEAFEVKTSQVLATRTVARPKQISKPKVTPSRRMSPDASLIAAVTKGDVVAARSALLKGANVEAKDEREMTALIYAAELGRLEIVQVLLAKGALIDTKDPSGATALGRAALWGHLPIVEALISKGADVNAGGDPDKEGILGPTPLTWAADNGHFEIVQLLLAKGVDPNKKAGPTKATSLILAAGGGFSTREIPPERSLKVVKELLDKGADLTVKDTYRWTALMHAAREGHLPIVDALLAKGADIDAKDGAGHTALMLAAMEGRTEVVRRLLEKGADVKAKNTDGKTALDIANSNGHSEVAGIVAAANFAEARKLIVGVWKTKGHTLDFHSDGSYEFAIRADWVGRTAVVTGTWSILGDIITMKESKPQTGPDYLVRWSRQWRIANIDSDRFEMKGLEFYEIYKASKVK